jgi:hypothetical protein
MKSHRFPTIISLASLLLLAAIAPVIAQKPAGGPVEDLRVHIDFERKGSFSLGPTGAKGWMHVSRNFMTTEARQIFITEVAAGSAAEGVLQAGDLVLGINGGHFESDARRALGNAIDEAETAANGGILKLTRWRATPEATPRTGTEEVVEVKLRVMGSYSDTAPYDCPKTARIMEEALAHLVERDDWGRFGDKALALLATGEPKHVALVRDYLHAAPWAKPDLKISLEAGGLVCWGYGYCNLVLTEYYLATKDDYVLPAIREYAVKTAMGQSSAGTWGHGFAWTGINDKKIHGHLNGYGALNQAGLPCFLSLILSKKCGIDDPEVDAAIARSSVFFRTFAGKGSIGYGFHRPSLEIHANGSNGMSGNGKNGIAAVAFRLLGEKEPTRFFSRLTASLADTCEYGHSGNSYSYFWDPLGAHCAGPANVAAFLKELRWYYALTRQADGQFVNQPLGGIYGGGFLSPTVAQVLIGALPRKALYITGKEMDESFWSDQKEVGETIAAGRWRLADTGPMSADDLIGELGSWSPIGREWVAMALANKEGDLVPRLTELLKSPRPEERAGACAALGYLGHKAAPAVPVIAEKLRDEGPVAISASYALARINTAARAALPGMLEAVLATEEEGLMRPVQQALAFSIGYAPGRVAPLYFDGLLPELSKQGNPLDGVDRALLYPAIAKLLKDPSGRTRGCGAYAFTHFSREDLAAMAQEVHDAITAPAVHYLMFDDEARQYALNLLLKHRIAEGVTLCLETMDRDRWGSGPRVEHRLATLKGYGGAAKAVLPELRGLLDQLKSDEQHAWLEDTIRAIESDAEAAPLESLDALVDERLARDLAAAGDDAERLRTCSELMKQHPSDTFYQSACQRLIGSIQGAGK